MMQLTNMQREVIRQLLRETRSPAETHRRIDWSTKPSKSWIRREAQQCGIQLVKSGRKLGQTGGGKRWTPTRPEVWRHLENGLTVQQIAAVLHRSEAIVRRYKKELATEVK